MQRADEINALLLAHLSRGAGIASCPLPEEEDQPLPDVRLADPQSFPDDAIGHCAAGEFYAAQKRLDDPEYGAAREALAQLAERGKA
ncbi:MAG: hypothetical protein H0U69_08070 [Trueperaceae bacterium]|nr:hypothetical protein [Trueperaceae bacterium]